MTSCSSAWRATASTTQRFVKALDRAALLRFHDLRHTFGTIAVQAFPLTDVKAYTGHADIATTLVYVHFVPQADAAAKLGRVVEGDGLQSGYRTGYPNARVPPASGRVQNNFGRC